MNTRYGLSTCWVWVGGDHVYHPGSPANSWRQHASRLHSSSWWLAGPLIRTRRIEISVTAFLWQVQHKATIFQSISSGNTVINHRRLGLHYFGWCRASSVVSVLVREGPPVAQLKVILGVCCLLPCSSCLDCIWAHRAALQPWKSWFSWRQSSSERIWRGLFSKSNRGATNADLSLSDVSSRALCSEYMPRGSIFHYPIPKKPQQGKDNRL